MKREIIFLEKIFNVYVCVTAGGDTYSGFIGIPARHKLAGKDVLGCFPEPDEMLKHPDAAACYTHSCDSVPMEMEGIWWYGWDCINEFTLAQAKEDALKVGEAWFKIVNNTGIGLVRKAMFCMDRIFRKRAQALKAIGA